MSDQYDVFGGVDEYFNEEDDIGLPTNSVDIDCDADEIPDDIQAILGEDPSKKKKPTNAPDKELKTRKRKSDETGRTESSPKKAPENIKPTERPAKGASSSASTRRKSCHSELDNLQNTSGFDDSVHALNSLAETLTTSSGRLTRAVVAAALWSLGAPSSGAGVYNGNSGRNTGRGRSRRQVFRAHRNLLAERAAELPTVDTIDLVSSPIHHIPGVVNVDSDDEIEADLSFDAANPEIRVKVKWMDKVEVHILRKHQKFDDLIKVFADRNNVNVNDIMFNIGDRIIEKNDTPDTIDYNICKFISGRILKNSACSSSTNVETTQRRDKNSLTFKIQSNMWKKPLTLTIKKTDTFKILFIKCAEELKISVKQIKLSFDGEALDMDSTPDDLEMEGDELIDCRIKQ